MKNETKMAIVVPMIIMVKPPIMPTFPELVIHNETMTVNMTPTI